MSTEPFLGEITLFSFDFAPKGWAQCSGQVLPINQNQALFSLLGTTYGGNGKTTFALPDLRGRVPNGAGQGPGLELYTLGQSAGVETTTLLLGQLPLHIHAITNALTFTARCRNSASTQQTPAGNVPGISALLPYTDAAVMPGATVIRAVHVTELQTRIDAFRAAFGLAAFAYSNPMLSVGSTVVQAQHVLDLRTALTQGYAAAGLPPPAYTDAIVVGTTVVKAVHLTELRDAVDAVTPVGTTYSRSLDADMNPGMITVSGGFAADDIGGNQPHENNQPFLVLKYCIALQGIFPSPN